MPELIALYHALQKQCSSARTRINCPKAARVASDLELHFAELAAKEAIKSKAKRKSTVIK